MENQLGHDKAYGGQAIKGNFTYLNSMTTKCTAVAPSRMNAVIRLWGQAHIAIIAMHPKPAHRATYIPPNCNVLLDPLPLL